ncbi:ABC transporter permease [Archangium primigenium]|uniref:ABC transporter permease n=1 Tax=[Archangium] primigenium TaxID=2792470 RepID=UPI00195E3D3E|nr:ABC-2 family transporter protein [Archangium primigenium]MBM7113834.1 ABC-2 family transporter protein [Archangium primigenium]
MSVRGTIRAFPTLLRVGVSEAVAYRAEMIVWFFSTTMPFISMALWTAVARYNPVGRYDSEDFVRYFLATFSVRQVTGSWVAWQMNYEVRQGTLAMRLLRPISPLWAYAAENLGYMPLRALMVLPIVIFSLVHSGAAALPRTAWGWLFLVLALVGGWLITFLANVAIGSLSLYIESSQRLMDVWFALFLVGSGYLYPVELFPSALKGLLDWLPFRYQIGLPTEIMINAHGFSEALGLLARQWAWVAVLLTVSVVSWKRGLKRFAAYGG